MTNNITKVLADMDPAAGAEFLSSVKRMKERTGFTGQPCKLRLTMTISRSRETRGELMLKCEIVVTLAKLERDGSVFLADSPHEENIRGN